MANRRTVVCFGDSNTYGVVPSLARGGGHRFSPDRRWPGVMRRELGEGFDIIEEGHSGRTTVHDDPIDGAHKNGLRALPICLESHAPIDLVIVLLGVNDLKHRFGMGASDVADSIEVIVEYIRRSGAGPGGAAPAVLLIAPPPVQEVGRLGELFAGGAAKALRLGGLLADVAKRAGIAFLDAGTIIEVSAIDGVHYDSDAHKALGGAVAKATQGILG